jgi:hypothetical protein
MDYDDLLKKRGMLATTGLTEDEIFSRMYRSGGDCLCELCGKPYRKHPYVDEARDWEDHPYLHILCDGGIVKL